jgi:hypothetical protein
VSEVKLRPPKKKRKALDDKVEKSRKTKFSAPKALIGTGYPSSREPLLRMTTEKIRTNARFLLAPLVRNNGWRLKPNNNAPTVVPIYKIMVA